MSNLFKSKKTETSKTEIDPQVYNRVLSNLQFAEQVAAIPYEPYRGLMVAPFTRDYMAGEAATRRIAQEGGFVPEVEAAARNAMALMGYQPERVGAERIGTALAGGPERISAGRVGTQFAAPQIGAREIGASLARGPERITAGQVGTTFAPERIGAGRVGTTFAARDIAAPGAAPTVQAASFLGQDLGRYMNPYEQAVIETGLEDLDRAERARQAELGRRATAARAFGGSRQAVEAGIAAGEAARERNRFVAEQRAQAFREAAALRGADVAREQEAALANQSAAQNIMELAQRGQITNQQRDLELARLGVTAEQANVDAQMRAALANQQAMQEAERARLTAETTNVQAGLEAARANQAAIEAYMRAGLSAEEANQRAQMDAATRNQAAIQEAQRLGLTAETTNVQAGLEAARANQQAIENYMRMGLTAEEANQRAMLEAGRANQEAGLRGAEFRLGAGRELAGFGTTALQNRYGAASALMGLGSAQQQLYQQFLNAQREEDLRRQQFPLQQLAIRQGAVAASPMNQTTSTTQQSRDSLAKIGTNIVGFGQNMGIPGFGSDMRMKRDVEKIKNPLDKVNRLKGIEFEWEDGYGSEEDEDEGGERDMSVSAQDVEKVMPSAVSRRKSDDMRQVDVPQMIGLLTEAVKELDAKVSKKVKK